MRLMIACRAIDNMAGGVERQAIALANEMARRGYEVSLLTLDHQDAQAFYDIDKSVRWYKLGIGDPKEKAGWSLRFRRMREVRRIMKAFSPDLVLAFQDGMFSTLYFYTLFMGVPIIAAERESLDRHNHVKSRTPLFVVMALYRFAHHITVQCESYVKDYPANLQSKITVVPNAIKQAMMPQDSKDHAGAHKTILCVGRLTYQKNQRVLLEAFSQIHENYPEWRLQFIGNGGLKLKLVQMSKDLQIEDKVNFLEATKDISKYYRQADILCIPSYWEGFPNVLGEALAHGLPAVGFKGCKGVCDLIDHEENGLLADGIDDMTTLKDMLRNMMGNDDGRKVMGVAAVKSMEKYAPEIVYNQWDCLFKELAK